MAKRAYGLDWLDEKNMTQRAWAQGYLKKKGKLPASTHTGTPITHAYLLEKGHELEKTAEGMLILKAMRLAWRQQEYRQPKHGRRPYTFTLPIQTKHQLSQQAEKCQHSEAEHLIKLIELGYEETIAQSKYMQETRTKERKDLPKARAEIRAQKMYAKSLESYLERYMKERFAAEGVADEDLDQKVEREMDCVRREAWKAIEEQSKTDIRLRHLSTL